MTGKRRSHGFPTSKSQQRCLLSYCQWAPSILGKKAGFLISIDNCRASIFSIDSKIFLYVSSVRVSIFSNDSKTFFWVSCVHTICKILSKPSNLRGILKLVRQFGIPDYHSLFSFWTFHDHSSRPIPDHGSCDPSQWPVEVGFGCRRASLKALLSWKIHLSPIPRTCSW